MSSTNKISIYSSSVISYEQKGKEIWFRIQIIPVREPCYSIQRRYEDFIDLSKQLKQHFPQYNHKQQQKKEKEKNNNNKKKKERRNKIQPLSQDPFQPTIHHHHHDPTPSSSSTTALLRQLPKLSTFPTITLNSTLFDYLVMHTFFNANKRQKQLDDYLYKLFTISGGSRKRRKGRKRRKRRKRRREKEEEIKDDNTIKNEDRYTKSLPPSPTQSFLQLKKHKSTILSTSFTSPQLDHNNSIILQQPSPYFYHQQEQTDGIKLSQSTTTTNTFTSSSSCSLLKELTISLYIGSETYITVHYPRNELNLTILKRLLNRQLILEGYEILPVPLVLAYNHITTTDRQGALKTLTLNSKDSWLTSDQHHTIIDLACSQKIAFFSTSPPSTSSSTSSLSTLDSNHHHSDSSNNNNNNEHQQSSWKNCHWIEDNVEKVLLIATDKDLAAAIYGKWRRLDHVTLTCLAH
ncbi:unnamed protein product [Cunninghamella echinulata]